MKEYQCKKIKKSRIQEGTSRFKMVRQPAVAGMFYEERPDELQNQVNDCFGSAFGPAKHAAKAAIGVISPHAGYQYSGPCAAWAHKEIHEKEIPDAFIMLGLSHSGFKSCLSLEDWKTPFGIIKNETELGKKIADASGIIVDEKIHSKEHSIEVQLPFLQFVNKAKKDDIKIVPIIVSHDIDHIQLAGDIARAIKKEKKKVKIIASSDFTHYGLNYGYFPFSKNVKENMYALDKAAIDFVLGLDSLGFLDYVTEKRATICGMIPIAVCIELCKEFGAKKGRLLKYYTSGDIIGDYRSAVGYAAIALG